MSAKKEKIDVSKIDLAREAEKVAKHPGLIPMPHHRGGIVVKAEDEGKIKGRAMAAMRDQTDMHMAQIYEQMRLLADQAMAVKKRVQISERIYKAKMGFEPFVGKEYYLYEKTDGTDMLSLLSPGDWGRKIPYSRYLAHVKLLADHTWEVLDDPDEELEGNTMEQEAEGA